MDRTPPNNTDAEQTVIGSALVYGERSLANALGLRSDEFFLPAHRDAWDAIRAVERKPSGLVEPLAVGEELKASGLHARYSPSWLEWAVSTSSKACLPEQVPHFAGIVRETSASRKLIEICTEVIARAYANEPWADLLEVARSGIGDLETAGADTQMVHVYEPMREFAVELEKRQDGAKPELVTTAISTLDDVIDGLEPGQLVIVAARPGHGKTALACNIAAANGLRGIPCAVFSLEMRMRKLARRMLIWHTRLSGQRLAEADLQTWNKIQNSVGDFDGATLWLCDSTRKLGQIVSEACRWHARYVAGKHKRAAIMVDYAQLVRVVGQKGRNREQEVAEIAGQMKGLAMHLGVPVILLAQLNRACETRGGPPMLSDLRESGSLEQDADIVLFPWRDLPAGDQTQRNEPGPAQIIVAKNRDGRIGSAPVEWIPELMTFRAAMEAADQSERKDWE